MGGANQREIVRELAPFPEHAALHVLRPSGRPHAADARSEHQTNLAVDTVQQRIIAASRIAERPAEASFGCS